MTPARGLVPGGPVRYHVPVPTVALSVPRRVAFVAGAAGAVLAALAVWLAARLPGSE